MERTHLSAFTLHPCSTPDRIRTDDLHRDRVASTPGCSARVCLLSSTGTGEIRTHTVSLLRRPPLPLGYSAVRAPRQESNLQHTRRTGPLCRWRTRNSSDPGWTRTTDRLLVGELPSPLGHRTVSFLLWPCTTCVVGQPQSGSRGTRTHNGREPARCFQDRLLIQPVDFQFWWRGES